MATPMGLRAVSAATVRAMGNMSRAAALLVISAVSKQPVSTGDVAAFDEVQEEKGYAIRTGWGKEHRLECQFSDSTAVKCTKNKTHAMLITSMQQVADRK